MWVTSPSLGCPKTVQNGARIYVNKHLSQVILKHKHKEHKKGESGSLAKCSGREETRTTLSKSEIPLSSQAVPLACRSHTLLLALQTGSRTLAPHTARLLQGRSASSWSWGPQGTATCPAHCRC